MDRPARGTGKHEGLAGLNGFSKNPQLSCLGLCSPYGQERYLTKEVVGSCESGMVVFIAKAGMLELNL